MAQSGASSTAIPVPENIDAISTGNAADNNERPPQARRNRMRLLAEKKRRSRVMKYFGELRGLMPHVTDKSDKVTLVGEAINYIQSLEKTKAMLENRKLARQAAAEAMASSSAPPQAVQGMAAAMFPDVPADGCHDVPAPPLQPLVAAVPAPPQFPMVTAGLVGFQTWSWPNLVLNVSNDNAYIHVYSPRHLNMQNMVMALSVLNNYGIDVLTTQLDADAVRSVFNIYARVARMGGENPSSEEVYKLAISEILLLLKTN